MFVRVSAIRGHSVRLTSDKYLWNWAFSVCFCGRTNTETVVLKVMITFNYCSCSLFWVLSHHYSRTVVQIYFEKLHLTFLSWTAVRLEFHHMVKFQTPCHTFYMTIPFVLFIIFNVLHHYHTALSFFIPFFWTAVRVDFEFDRPLCVCARSDHSSTWKFEARWMVNLAL